MSLGAEDCTSVQDAAFQQLGLCTRRGPSWEAVIRKLAAHKPIAWTDLKLFLLLAPLCVHSVGSYGYGDQTKWNIRASNLPSFSVNTMCLLSTNMGNAKPQFSNPFLKTELCRPKWPDFCFRQQLFSCRFWAELLGPEGRRRMQLARKLYRLEWGEGANLFWALTLYMIEME